MESRNGGRFLALDVGDRRIGLALSDPLGVTAQPAGFLERRGAEEDVAAIVRFVREHGVERVVVGLPLDVRGGPGAQARRVLDLVEALRPAVDVPVETIDERYTTRQAERALIEGGVRREERRRRVDAVAAALILQTYLERISRLEPRGSTGSDAGAGDSPGGV